jgi:uncharacterized RDD family membrane protein YckC
MSQPSTPGATYPGPSYHPAAAPLLSDERLLGGVLLRRLAAWWIDVCLIAVLGVIAWVILVTFGVLTLGLGLPLLSVLPLLPLAYNWGFLASGLQATPGQAMCDLIVVRDEDLGRPSVAEALVSTLCFYLTLAILVLLLAVALFTTRHRTLHDLGAGLVVVRRRALNGWLA